MMNLRPRRERDGDIGWRARPIQTSPVHSAPPNKPQTTAEGFRSPRRRALRIAKYALGICAIALWSAQPLSAQSSGGTGSGGSASGGAGDAATGSSTSGTASAGAAATGQLQPGAQSGTGSTSGAGVQSSNSPSLLNDPGLQSNPRTGVNQTLGNDALNRQIPNALNDQPAGRASAIQDERAGAARDRPLLNNEANEFRQPRVLNDRRATEDLRSLDPPLDPEARSGLDADARGRLDQDSSAIGDRLGRQGTDSSGRATLGVFLVESDGPGVRIRSIVSDSAADEAGLQPGDVILAVDGQEVSRSSEIAQLIREHAVGDQARIEVWRDGEQGEIVATLNSSRRGPYNVGYRGDRAGSSDGDRTAQLERRLDMVIEELEQLRAQVDQLQGTNPGGQDRGAASGSRTGVNGPMAQPTLPPSGNTGPGDGLPGRGTPPSSSPNSVPPTTPPAGTSGAGTSDAGLETGGEAGAPDPLFE